MRQTSVSLLICAFLSVFGGCAVVTTNPPPRQNAFTATPGSSCTIYGSNFTPEDNAIQITSTTSNAEVYDIPGLSSTNGTSITFTIPSNARPGSYWIKVGAFNSEWSKAETFIITAPSQVIQSPAPASRPNAQAAKGRIITAPPPVVQPPAPVSRPNAQAAKGRFDGNWREEKALVGPEYKPQNSQQPIQRLSFEGKTFRLVWHPFEVYYDYWGTYTCDQAKGKIEFKIDYGNFIPKDFAGKGTYSFDDRGRLVLRGVWFGTPRNVQATGDFRGHIFVNRLSLRTSSLHEAAANGNTKALQELIARGEDVNQMDEREMTPLHLAASRGHKLAVKLLLSSGAEVDARGGGVTALDLAALAGRAEIAELLIEAGADLTVKNSSGHSPLQLMLSGSFSPWVFGAGGVPSDDDILKTVELFINRGADLHDNTLLPLAAANSSTNVVNLLLRRGAAVNSRDKEGFTALHRAARRSGTDMVKLLLDSGADVHAQGGHANQTPLHEAIGGMGWSLPVVELLLARGADVNAKDSSGTTPLHEAAWFIQKEVAELLLDKGADIHAKGGWAKRTPLHQAADGDDRKKPTVELLLNRGAEVNAQDELGNTPLHLAASNDGIGIVELLVQRGANIRAKNKVGKSPVELAAAAKKHEIVVLLEAAGSKSKR